MEHWEEIKPGGFRFVWDDALFRPGTDTFLLSAFPRLKAGLRVCDLGSGTGLLGLLLLQRQPALAVTGIEQLPQAAALARRCALENRLTECFSVVCLDFRQAAERFPSGGFDLIVSNPPYYAQGRGGTPENPPRRAARSEASCTMEELVQSAAYLLRWGGAFCLIHKPERLTDLLCVLRASACEPKRLRFVCERGGVPPSLVLLEGRRGGRPGLSVDAPLILRRPDGSPTAELDRVYFREKDSIHSGKGERV